MSVLAHEFLYWMVNNPRFINPIFYMGRFTKVYITFTLIALMDYLNLLFSTVHVNRSVSVVTHKLIELSKTCMDSILKALSTVTNENRREKVYTMIKQLKM